MPKDRITIILLSLSMFFTGACGMTNEYLLGTLGSNLMGSTHEQIYVIIGVMMASMGLGSWLSKHIRGGLFEWFICIEMTLGIVGGISILAVYTAYSYMASYNVVLYLFAVSIGTLIGMEIPLVIRMVNKYKSVKDSLGNILAWDYVGSLAGALFFAFFLVGNVELHLAAPIAGMVNVCVALVAAFWIWSNQESDLKVRPHRVAISFLPAVALFILSAVFWFSDGMMKSFEQMSYRDPIVHSETSKYQHLVVTKRDERINLYINGHLQFSSFDERIYHEMLVHIPMSLPHNLDKVLILGGGDGLALREILKYPSVDEVVLVDLDPAITNLARSNELLVELNEGSVLDSRVSVLTPKGISSDSMAPVMTTTILKHRFISDKQYKTASVETINMDASQFIQGVAGQYDCIIIDFPDPNCVELAKLYSTIFYQNLRSVLAPGGVVCVQSTSPVHAKKVFLCINETMREAGWKVLPYHQNVPSFGHWAWNLAWLHDESVESVTDRINIEVPTEYVTKEVALSATYFPKGWLDYKLVEPTTDMLPRIINYHRESWRN